MKIQIFDKDNDFKPKNFFYDTKFESVNSSLDDLPIEAVQAIKFVHEANLRTAANKRRDNKSQSPSPVSGRNQ